MRIGRLSVSLLLMVLFGCNTASNSWRVDAEECSRVVVEVQKDSSEAQTGLLRR